MRKTASLISIAAALILFGTAIVGWSGNAEREAAIKADYDQLKSNSSLERSLGAAPGSIGDSSPLASEVQESQSQETWEAVESVSGVVFLVAAFALFKSSSGEESEPETVGLGLN